MKVAVIKLGSRISWGGKDTSGGNYEAKKIIEMLYKGGASVDIYTKILKKDVLIDDYKFFNIEDEFLKCNKVERSYDALIVLNGNYNCFGGVENPDAILNYYIINNFDGKVFYIYCDPSLTLKQCWGSIKSKEWSKNWSKDDIFISRDDITYIAQPYDLDSVKELIEPNGIEIKNIIHYPTEKFPCLDPVIPINLDYKTHLSYGGTMRGNRRIEKMIKYYFGYSEDINVEMFGKIDIDELRKYMNKVKNIKREPLITGSVDAIQYLNKSNETLSHVVIGDKWYEGKDIPQRTYQSIYTSVVTFIDKELDPQKRVYSDHKIGNFLYVESQDEVEKKIRDIKNNSNIREHIIKSQFEAINFDSDKYCKDFVSMLKNNI